MINREAALEKLKSYQPDSYQYQHALYSEAIMRALAPRFEADPDVWGLCGLLHDIDFPLTKHTPEQHGLKAKELLEGIDGMTDEIVNAIMAHNSEHTGVQPSCDLDYALRCSETVTGLICAAALMRPTGMEGMEPKSIKKKMKDKAFAAAVSRENIRECEKIGLPLDDFLAIAIKAMS